MTWYMYTLDPTFRFQRLVSFKNVKRISKFHLICAPSRNEILERYSNTKLISEDISSKDLNNEVDSSGSFHPYNTQEGQRGDVNQLTIIRFQGETGYNTTENMGPSNLSNVPQESFNNNRLNSSSLINSLDREMNIQNSKIMKQPRRYTNDSVALNQNTSNPSIEGF